MFRVGAPAFDRLMHEHIEIAHVRLVPEARDLFNDPLPAYRIFTVRYFNGQYAERREGELEPAGSVPV